jgi:hypothetical protein
LNHPHIRILYDLGSLDATEYLVMELVEGTPLRGPMPGRSWTASGTGWSSVISRHAEVVAARRL